MNSQWKPGIICANRKVSDIKPYWGRHFKLQKARNVKNFYKLIYRLSLYLKLKHYLFVSNQKLHAIRNKLRFKGKFWKVNEKKKK